MILMKTMAGVQAMKDRSIPLSPRQRSAFILCDAKRSVQKVLAATTSIGVTRDDVDLLVSLGLLSELAESPGDSEPSRGDSISPALDEIAQQAPPPSQQQRYSDAYTIAIRLTSAMGLRGFRLNLAVEGATSYEQLLTVAPRIRDAVGPEKFQSLELALYGD